MAEYVYLAIKASGLDKHEVEYRLPMAQGYQLIAAHLESQGVTTRRPYAATSGPDGRTGDMTAFRRIAGK